MSLFFWIWTAGAGAGILSMPSLAAYHKTRYRKDWSDNENVPGPGLYAFCISAWPVTTVVLLMALLLIVGYKGLAWPGKRLGTRAHTRLENERQHQHFLAEGQKEVEAMLPEDRT